jgi:hypothetical protein
MIVHITPLQASVSHLIPSIHVLDLWHNKAIPSRNEATNARQFAVKAIRERGHAAKLCDKCMAANVAWYEDAFDRCVSQLFERGTIVGVPYEEYVSPCWSEPGVLNVVMTGGTLHLPPRT